jgi:hypothetical protein
VGKDLEGHGRLYLRLLSRNGSVLCIVMTIAKYEVGYEVPGTILLQASYPYTHFAVYCEKSP